MGCNCKETYNAQQRHQETCDYIHQELWLPKNAAYGDSFHELYKDLGIISAVTQITHKYNRLKNLAKDKNANRIDAGDESIQDTLLDLANYCIMTYLELEREEYERCQCETKEAPAN